MLEKIDKNLKRYVENNILSEYVNFDKGHDVNHAMAVIERSFIIIKEHNLQAEANMVYCVAAYHDLGMKIERKNHPLHSKELLLKDKNLTKWFSGEQIKIMADAVEDHSTSRNGEPRSVYGKIVSDADKDTDINVGILRGWNFSIKNNPNFTFDEHIINLQTEMIRRFCKNEKGERLVSLFYGTKEQCQFIDEMEALALNRKALTKRVKELTENNLKEKYE